MQAAQRPPGHRGGHLMPEAGPRLGARCSWRGLDHFKAYVCSAEVAHNLYSTRANGRLTSHAAKRHATSRRRQLPMSAFPLGNPFCRDLCPCPPHSFSGAVLCVESRCNIRKTVVHGRALGRKHLRHRCGSSQDGRFKRSFHSGNVHIVNSLETFRGSPIERVRISPTA